MTTWLEVAFGAIVGVLVIVGVFWFTFRRMPERRSDGGLTQHDAAFYSSGDDGGGHHSP
jgi:nitrate reductase gamma subunit